MNPDLSVRLTAAVEQMPAFPKSVQKILHLTRDVACLPKDLAQEWDVIQRHHGQGVAHSAPGQGSTFRMTLPTHQAAS